jgi:HK97 family phage portal protein
MAKPFIYTLANAIAPRVKAGLPVPVSENRGGWYRIYESFTGAWQHNAPAIDVTKIISNPVMFACTTRIASDGAKLRTKLLQLDETGIWSETTNSAYSPVLRKPNRFQNHIQFKESWFLAKLQTGNAVALKERDARGIVIALYVLDWSRVTPMVADDGEVFYQLRADNISGVERDVLVPASEVIHDRYNCLFHPLVGTSPIFAAGVAATQGLNIQNNSAWFFGNRSQPGGVLTAPGNISDETAARLKARWEEGFTGSNAGKVAVLGDDLKYVPMAQTAVDSQLIDQLKWSSEAICSAYGVPPFMVGAGPIPANASVETLLSIYYSQCLQVYLEEFETCLDEGLALAQNLGLELDTDALLRMDVSTQYKTLAEGVKGSILAPNEARKKVNLKPLPGGDSVYLQQQNYSLEALAKRDAADDPFGTSSKTEQAQASNVANDNQLAAEANKALLAMHKGLA